jgi:SAM-dependent methyltransferase
VIIHGECLGVLRKMPDASIDAIVTDPPYELGFMGKAWDRTGIANSVELWSEALRVLKPGGHLLSFSHSRTVHRMTCAIEDAGFEIRDGLQWWYGTGFPKSLDVSKALGDNADAVKRWAGFGTALKPAHEPIVLARKPVVGTIAANVLAHGTGALNIDGCRIATADDLGGGAYAKASDKNAADASSYATGVTGKAFVQPAGRWPSNVILSHADDCGTDACAGGCPVAELDRQSGISKDGTHVGRNGGGGKPGGNGRTMGAYAGGANADIGYGGSGGASRFFYVTKPSRRERDVGCAHLPATTGGKATDRAEGSAGLASPRTGAGRKGGSKNHHPTVKPIELMRYLCRLVTPPGGHVLDPFCGSGTTGIAAAIEGFAFTGIEQSAEYIEIAQSRIAGALYEFVRQTP